MSLKNYTLRSGFSRIALILSFTVFSLLFHQCSHEPLSNDQESSSEVNSGDYTKISFDHPLAQKVFLTLEAREHQVLEAMENGVDFTYLNINDISYTEGANNTIVNIPFTGDYNGYQLVLLAQLPVDGSSVKLYLQESEKLENIVPGRDFHLEFYALDFSVSFFGTGKISKSLNLTARGDSGESITDGIDLEGVTVTAPSVPSSSPGTATMPSRSSGVPSYPSGGGNNTGTNGPGHGGGSSSSDSNSSSSSTFNSDQNQNRNKLCGEYSWKKIGNSHTVNITELGFTAYNPSTKTLLNYDYPNLCITVPEYRYINGVKQTISAQIATTKFNLAWRQAVNRTLLGLAPDEKSSYRAATILLKNLKQALSTAALGSKITQGFCKGNTNTSEARYCM